jgi:hypothetical protein
LHAFTGEGYPLTPGAKAALQAQPCPGSDGVWKVRSHPSSAAWRRCWLCIMLHSFRTHLTQEDGGAEHAVSCLLAIMLPERVSTTCVQVDMFTGESVVLVSLRRLFAAVREGSQAGALLLSRLRSPTAAPTELCVYSNSTQQRDRLVLLADRTPGCNHWPGVPCCGPASSICGDRVPALGFQPAGKMMPALQRPDPVKA